ncbi:hypothetical protein GOODEAATRI_023777 [Goodea atripinnis]|uniref:Uncharacterized protein n=1 Tax=Goodea atripinnis TaxID=208336 RepID=A0ABV0P7A2_9TELE
MFWNGTFGSGRHFSVTCSCRSHLSPAIIAIMFFRPLQEAAHQSGGPDPKQRANFLDVRKVQSPVPVAAGSPSRTWTMPEQGPVRCCHGHPFLLHTLMVLLKANAENYALTLFLVPLISPMRVLALTILLQPAGVSVWPPAILLLFLPRSSKKPVSAQVPTWMPLSWLSLPQSFHVMALLRLHLHPHHFLSLLESVSGGLLILQLSVAEVV